MPPRKRVSDPAGRVYKHITPLKQTTLPGAKRRIKTTYGKKASNRLPKQETLTQMDFVKLQQMEDQDYIDDVEQVEVKKLKRKRGKTEGDEPERTPQFHTQTITQLDWSFNEATEEEERSIFDIPSSSQSPKPPKTVKKRKGRAKGVVSPPRKSPSHPALEDKQTQPALGVPSSSKSNELPKNARKRKAKATVAVSPARKSPVRNMPSPQTPHQWEIPSSRSPATPLSLNFRGSTRRTPLKEMSMNTPISFNSNPTSQDNPFKLPQLRVEDSMESGTHASQISRIPTTPSKRPSPAKSVRFALPDVHEEKEEAVSPSTKLQSTSYPRSQVSLSASQRTEISDSEAESEDEETQGLPISTARVEDEDKSSEGAVGGTEAHMPHVQDEDEPVAETGSFYGEFGLETQMEAERILDSPRLSGNFTTTQTQESPEPETFLERTQIMESQRLATQYMDVMAPRTANSDIFISISPQDVTKILNRVRDHFMKPFAFPPTVSRVWIYETKPVSTLKYMAEISSAKRPGEIADERGQGNADFNGKKGPAWNAYEFMQLYELADPLPLAKLTENEWLKQAPKRFEWVRPAVLDQLMANLKPPLFDTPQTDGPSTDTQEAEAQLLSTIKQFTQPVLSSQPQSNQFIKPEIENYELPSSTHATPRTYTKRKAPPASQATTVDLSQTQTPRRHRHQSMEEVISESPTRPVQSSTPLKLPSPLSGGSHRGPDSLVPYSMASSQLLTKSQLLPESLLNGSVPGPPLFIQDSDDEELD